VQNIIKNAIKREYENTGLETSANNRVLSYFFFVCGMLIPAAALFRAGHCI
jgi:hypothetical protein